MCHFRFFLKFETNLCGGRSGVVSPFPGITTAKEALVLVVFVEAVGEHLESC